jgi:acyl carrier protein
MTDAEIYQQLRQVFRMIFDDLQVELTPETSAADIPEWTSFNHVNIIVATEQAFKIRFSTSDIESLNNVGQLVTLIRSKLAKKPA